MRCHRLVVAGLRLGFVSLSLVVATVVHAEDPAPPRERAEALIVEAGHLAIAGSGEPARAKLDEAIALFHDLDDRQGEAAGWVLRGVTGFGDDDEPQAAADFQRGLALAPSPSDALTAWMFLWGLAKAEKRQEHFETAETHLREALRRLETLATSSEPMHLEALMLLQRAFGGPNLGADPLSQLGDLKAMAPIFNAMMSRLATGAVRCELGGVLVKLGRLDEAEVELKAADEISQFFGGIFGTATPIYWGDLNLRRGSFEKARASYREALDALDRGPMCPICTDSRLQGHALDRLAELELLAGRCPEALAWKEQGLSRARADGDPRREARGLEERADLLRNCGRFAEADAEYKRALEVALTGGDVYRQAAVLVDLGNLDFIRGRFGEALASLERAAALLDEQDQPILGSVALAALAQLHFLMHTPGVPTATVEKARKLAMRTDWDLAGPLIATLESLEKTGWEGGDPAAMLRQLEAVLGRPTLFGDPSAGMALQVLRYVELVALGAEDRESLRNLDPSLIEQAQTGSQPLESLFAQALLGARSMVLQDYVAARGHYQAACNLAQQLGNTDLEASMALAVGSTYWQEGRRQESFEWFERATAGLEKTASGIPVEEVLASYLADRQLIYNLLVTLSLRDGQVEKAFLLSERSRARAFLNSLGNQLLSPAAGADPNLVAQANGLRAQISAWEEEQGKSQSSQRQQALGEQLAHARRDWENILVRLKITNPEFSSMVTVEPPGLAELQAALPADVSLVSYFVTGEGARAWVLDREGLRLAPLSASATEVREVACFAQGLAFQRGRAEPLRGIEVLSDCSPREEAAERLYDTLFRPLEPLLRHRRLYLVPHGVLHYLPFAALRDRQTGRYLIEDFTISYLPSASVLALLAAKESPVDGTSLVLGDPSSRDPLSGARLEAEQVGRLLGVEPLLGERATEESLYHLGRKVDLLHVAAHAFFLPGSPRFSRVVLAPGGGLDGNLEVHEVLAGVDLSGVNLVVLSACQSGVGERSAGDEVVGLTRALLYAGSPGVISTLWNVDDRATAELMVEFYRRLVAGEGAAEALRGSQLALRGGEHSDPFYWAGFSLTGDPQGRWGKAVPKKP